MNGQRVVSLQLTQWGLQRNIRSRSHSLVWFLCTLVPCVTFIQPDFGDFHAMIACAVLYADLAVITAPCWYCSITHADTSHALGFTCLLQVFYDISALKSNTIASLHFLLLWTLSFLFPYFSLPDYQMCVNALCTWCVPHLQTWHGWTDSHP